jgi:hypothetical protein
MKKIILIAAFSTMGILVAQAQNAPKAKPTNNIAVEAPQEAAPTNQYEVNADNKQDNKTQQKAEAKKQQCGTDEKKKCESKSGRACCAKKQEAQKQAAPVNP